MHDLRQVLLARPDDDDHAKDQLDDQGKARDGDNANTGRSVCPATQERGAVASTTRCGGSPVLRTK